MQINGEGQNGIIVQSLDTRNTSAVKTIKRQEQAAHVPKFVDIQNMSHISCQLEQ